MSDRQQTILLADDDTAVLEVLEEYLLLQGFKVLVSENGREALRELKKEQIDLVLTDMYMPEMTGMDLIERVRRYDQQVPIILLTGYSTVELTIDALRAGATNFIVKPFDLEELHKIIQTTLQRVAEAGSFTAINQYLSQFQRSFSLPTSEDELVHLNRLFQHDLHGFGFSPSKISNYLLLLQELLFNAIYHGNLEISSEVRKEGLDGQRKFHELVVARQADPDYSERTVKLSWFWREDYLGITVRDDGPGFDWQLWLEKTVNIDSLGASGRGMMLIQSFADKIEFNERGNEITALLKLPVG
jgi:FixJ family two-component response regulator